MSVVEPGERARDLLRDADQAYADGDLYRASTAATMAQAWIGAAQLDLFERQWAEAKAADAATQKIMDGFDWMPVPRTADGSDAAP